MHATAPNPLATQPSFTRRWTIATMQVHERTEKLPDRPRHLLRYLQDYGQRNNLTRAEVAAKLEKAGGRNYEENTVYQELTVRREKPSPQFLDAIEALKKLEVTEVDAREARDFPFTMVSLAEEIFACCEMAREDHTIVFFYSPSHAGKTRPTEEFARRENEKAFNSVVCVRMPTNGYLSAFKTRLAIRLGISGHYSMAEMSERIIEWFRLNPDVLLAVDETSECFVGKTPRAARVDTFNFIREIHDESGCGIFLIGTEDTGTAFEAGPFKHIFKQLTNRGMVTVRHSGEPQPEDFDKYSRAIGLTPAKGTALDRQKVVVADESLGTWLKMLLRGRKRAERREEPFTWDHVLAADNIRKALGKKK